MFCNLLYHILTKKAPVFYRCPKYLIFRSNNSNNNLGTVVEPQWEKICEYNTKPAKCRLSTFGEVLNPDGTKADSNHRLYTTIKYDFFTIDGKPYPNVTTVNANGYNVSFKDSKGIIYWMSNTTSEFLASSEGGTTTIKTFEAWIIAIRNIFMKMANIIQRFLGFV